MDKISYLHIFVHVENVIRDFTIVNFLVDSEALLWLFCQYFLL